jgi:hypothetical protein
MSRRLVIVLVLAACPRSDDERTTVASTTSPPGATTSAGESSDGSDGEAESSASSADPSAASTGEPLPGACEDVAECRLHSDCCTCEALPAGDTPPGCDADCERPLCEAWGITEILCSHTCLVRLVECDAALVDCADPMPECDPGFVPSIESRCWTRHCVPAELCTPA